MDDPGMSLFQGNSLNIGNNENEEEAEDLEEQIRRREELQNLLTNALDDFKYDDSTINSSTNISVASADCLEQTYRDAQSPYEQLKLLYDIRMKEIRTLKEEFDNYKLNTSTEIDSLKRRLTLQEAETSQVEISLRSTKSLLVEKVNTITAQEKEIVSRDNEISNLKKIVEQLQYDVQAYNSTIEELQLKLTMNTGPFNVAARVFNAEELQSNYKDHIEKLETSLEEQRRKSEVLEKEMALLQDDLKRTIDNSNENDSLHNRAITLLNANVESAQNQCQDLLSLVEVLSKENEHYRGRIQKLEAGEPILLSNSFKRKSLDYDTLVTHCERLKKMLLDKDVEVCTLKSKAKFYENDIKELLEYRNIKNQALFNTECSLPEHAEKIALIQNEMKKMHQELIEKDQEISNLCSINKELEDKIENMIIQTRHDLENLSVKYKLPELETMNEELQNAEMKINELQQKLSKSEAEAEQLRSKIEKNNINELKLQLDEEEKKVTALEELMKNKQDGSIIEENNRLKKELADLSNMLQELNHLGLIKTEYDLLHKEYNQLTEQLRELSVGKDDENITKDMTVLRQDIESFWHIHKTKSVEKELIEIKVASWINQINLNCISMRNLKESESLLKKKSEELSNNLKQLEKEVEKLTEIIEEVNNSKTILEGEKCGLEMKINKLKNEINHKNDALVELKNEIDLLKNEDKNVTIQTLEDASQNLEEAKEELIKYQEELREKCEIIKKYENEIARLKVDVKSSKENLEVSQKEIRTLQKTVSVLLEKEQKMKNKENKASLENEDLFKATLLKAEVSVREELRKEYESKIARIEDTYRNIFEKNQQKLNEYKEQENNYRHQLADLLGKYAQLISPIQKENDELKEHLSKVEAHYNELKKYVDTTQKEYDLLVEKTRTDAQKAVDAWKMWAKTFVQGCLSIEKVNAQTRNTILKSLKEFDSQVESVDKYFEEKIKQYKAKHNLSKSNSKT